MTKKQKLELTWIGKDVVTKVEPRILIEDSERSYHASKRLSDADLFDNKFIVDLDLRSSGISEGKKSFMNLEVNFYLIPDDVDFKSKEIKDSLKSITQRIVDENFIGNDYFNFYLTKKGKTKEDSLQLENV